MIIDVNSQSTGIERLVEVGAAEIGVRVLIRDRARASDLAEVTRRLHPDAHNGHRAVPLAQVRPG